MTQAERSLISVARPASSRRHALPKRDLSALAIRYALSVSRCNQHICRATPPAPAWLAVATLLAMAGLSIQRIKVAGPWATLFWRSMATIPILGLPAAGIAPPNLSEILLTRLRIWLFLDESARTQTLAGRGRSLRRAEYLVPPESSSGQRRLGPPLPTGSALVADRHHQAPYSKSLTCSSQSTVLPS